MSGSRAPGSAGQPVRPKSPAAPKIPAVLATASIPDHDLTEDREYRAIEYRNIDLSSHTVEAVEINRCRFGDTTLAGTTLHRTLVSDTAFNHCDVSNVAARDSSLLRTTMETSRLTGMAWVGCSLRDVLFNTCRADLVTFRFSKFKTVLFQDCKLQQADFQHADLRGVRFEHCDLTAAQFSNAQLTGARFTNCVLTGIGGVTSFQGAIIKSDDVLGLAHSLATALGIVIEE